MIQAIIPTLFFNFKNMHQIRLKNNPIIINRTIENTFLGPLSQK